MIPIPSLWVHFLLEYRLVIFAAERFLLARIFRQKQRCIVAYVFMLFYGAYLPGNVTISSIFGVYGMSVNYSVRRWSLRCTYRGVQL